MKLADQVDGKGNRRADNKSDPNLETLTFGMWSTCDQTYRTHIGEENGRYLFFRTNWSNQAVLTGFYEIGWYLDSWYVAPAGKSKPPRIVTDRFLAAKHAHFVAEPIPVDDAAEAVGLNPAKFHRRSVIGFNEKQTADLRKLLLEQPDATPQYVEEIHRLEQVNLASTGRRYVNWDRITGFDWTAAEVCMKLAARPKPSDTVRAAWLNGTREGIWECTGCNQTIASPRPIKLCSRCDDGGCFLPTLEPVTV